MAVPNVGYATQLHQCSLYFNSSYISSCNQGIEVEDPARDQTQVRGVLVSTRQTMQPPASTRHSP